jgi:multicomponent Na+:H+ antiporter subunit D
VNCQNAGVTLPMSLAPYPVLIPLLAAAFVAAVGRWLPRRILDLFSVLVASSVSLICAILLSRSSHRLLVYWFGGWIPHGSAAPGIAFAIDPVGAGAAELASLLVLAGLIFSIRYFDSAGALYHILMLVFLGALCGFSLSGDLFDLFVFFELMSVSAFALCGHKTEEPATLQGAFNFAITNTVGAATIVAGIALLYGRTGALNLAQIGQRVGERPDGLLIVAFVFLAAGFLVKAAMVPFHFWLADAHAVAPTQVCVLFSGVMVELGLYAVMRLYWTIFSVPFAADRVELREVFLAVGALTCLVGAIMCFEQRHVKRLLAFSTVSHMGIMVMAAGMLTWGGLAGAAVYVVGHGFVKAGLFLGAGILLHRFGTVDEIELAGRGKGHWLTGAVFALGGLGLSGLPPFGTFFGDSLVSQSAARTGCVWIEVIIFIGAAVTGAAVLRVAGRVFMGWGRVTPAGEGPKIDEMRETKSTHGRIPAMMTAPALCLVSFALIIGLLPLRRAAASAAARMQDRAQYAAAVLKGKATLPSQPKSRSPIIPDVLRGVAVTLAAILIAAAKLFPHMLPKRLRQRQWTIWEKLIHGMQQIHSGHVGDYVMWLTWGIVGLGAALALLLR